MGLFSRKKRPKTVKSMGPKELETAILRQYGYTEDPDISPAGESAMRVITVHSCVTAMANSLKQLPMHLKYKQGDTRQNAEDHPLWELITSRPNPWMTVPEFLSLLAAHYSYRGNFYALIIRYGRRPTSLIPIHPDRVQEIRQRWDYTLEYDIRFDEPSGVRTIPGSEIFHVRGLSMDGINGLNKITYARAAYETALSFESHSHKTLKKGAKPALALETDASFETEEEAKEFLRKFNELHAGADSDERTMLLSDGLKANPLSLNFADMEFLNNRKFQKKEIVGLMFSIPIELMSTGDTTTFASAQEFNQSFKDFAIAPMVKAIEAAMGRDIVGREDTKKGYYVKIDINGFVRADIKTRMETYVAGVNAQIYSPNEVRAFEDMNPYEGGDEYKTRTSTTKSDNGGSQDEVPQP